MLINQQYARHSLNTTQNSHQAYRKHRSLLNLAIKYSICYGDSLNEEVSDHDRIIGFYDLERYLRRQFSFGGRAYELLEHSYSFKCLNLGVNVCDGFNPQLTDHNAGKVLKGLEHYRRYTHGEPVAIIRESELSNYVLKRYPNPRSRFIHSKPSVYLVRDSTAVCFEEVCPYVPRI